MKNTHILIGIVIAIVFGGITFFVTSSILFAAIVLLVSLLYFSLLLLPRVNKHKMKLNRYHECYNFINNFIISLSIKKSIVGAFETVTSSASDELLEEMDGVKELPEGEKIKYLQKYFPFHIYKLFTEVVQLWSEEGGDILRLSSHVINQSREIEDYIAFCDSIGKRKVFELVTLWGFTLLIIVILKTSLTGSLQKILENIIFQASIVGVFGLVLVSIEMAFSKMMNINIRGWENEK